MAWQNALGSTGLGFASQLVQSLQQRDMNLIGTQMQGIMEMASAMNPMVRDLENQAQLAMLQEQVMQPPGLMGFDSAPWSGVPLIQQSRASYWGQASTQFSASFASLLPAGPSRTTASKPPSILDRTFYYGGDTASSSGPVYANSKSVPTNPGITQSSTPAIPASTDASYLDPEVRMRNQLIEKRDAPKG